MIDDLFARRASREDDTAYFVWAIKHRGCRGRAREREARRALASERILQRLDSASFGRSRVGKARVCTATSRHPDGPYAACRPTRVSSLARGLAVPARARARPMRARCNSHSIRFSFGRINVRGTRTTFDSTIRAEDLLDSSLKIDSTSLEKKMSLEGQRSRSRESFDSRTRRSSRHSSVFVCNRNEGTRTNRG